MIIGNFKFKAYFKVFCTIWVKDSLRTFKDLSFAELGYQLLPIATSHLVGDNREFKVLGIFQGALLNMDR